MIFDKKVLLTIASIALLFIFPLGLLALWALLALNLAITSVYGAKNELEYEEMTATEKTLFHYKQYLIKKQNDFGGNSTLNSKEQQVWSDIVDRLNNKG